ncbi:MAG TPA: VOC family protein [Bacteroidales bacterium]|nr:VOC family protein [Bacteroidales bacterium]
MDKYIISGIQQIGIGVEDFAEAWKYYIDVFNMDIRILEDDTVAELMLPYTGNKPQKRHACIAINMQGGGGFEIWQYSERKPKPINFEIQVGDLGVFAAKIKSRNVVLTYEEFRKNPKIQIIGSLSKSIDNCHTFFMKDPFGNLFQIVHDKYILRDENRTTGGPVGAMIGVTDIDRALAVYSEILGYDKVITDETGTFEDISQLNAGKQKYRRLLLTHTQPRKGSFNKMFGPSYIELVQALERTPRKMYEDRYWGDPGFIQICFDIKNMAGLKKKCESLGFPFTVDSSVKHNEVNSFDMGEAAGHFTYIEDPDGNLIEFVETHKIPLIKKLGINLNLRKRDPEKSLPMWMLKALRFGRVKIEDIK